ncbi:LacI family DNA-binding transcriptional regulator [Cryptosporangium minutisporangium]|uniref:LacI family DNA-binding transcriptional regulator n=1 Tax=Cryptosporangium minutisporangium TaxID=113569 RepID=UPI0031F0B140
MSGAEVAQRAGVSRSAVSQILNGHTERFTDETVTRVREAARELGYRPSHAGRSLRRGRSDVVVTMVHERAVGPQLWDFVNSLGEDLAEVGLTHLLQIASPSDAVREAVIGLRPLAVVCTGPLPPGLHGTFAASGITVIEGALSAREAMDRSIGELQASHLFAAGYPALAPVRPVPDAGYLGTAAREAGARDWAVRHGMRVLPTVEIDLAAVDASFDSPDVGLACYNDEVALAMLGRIARAGRSVPDDVGVVGVDDSLIAHISAPTITTIRLNLEISRKAMVQYIVGGDEPDETLPIAPPPDVTVVQGESTRLPG